MSFISKLLGINNTKEKQIDGLGEFLYCDDGSERYWAVEKSIGNLPSKFDFGAISGGAEGPDLEAIEAFRSFSAKPDTLYGYLNETFFSKLEARFGDLTLEDIKSGFYLKSLTCTSIEEFEFGFHSSEADVFVELFCRGGVVTEVHVDEGCCRNV